MVLKKQFFSVFPNKIEIQEEKKRADRIPNAATSHSNTILSWVGKKVEKMVMSNNGNVRDRDLPFAPDEVVERKWC